MSNRYSQNNRGYPKPQNQKFVPRNPNNSTYIPGDSPPPPTLSNSLRQSHAASSSASASNRLQKGDNGDWVPNNKLQNGNFVNYLPQDEAVAAGLAVDEGGLDPVESQRVVDLLNRELSRLLKLNAMDFWREVASDTSLHAFLESFLKFRSRWYDFPYRGAKGIVAGVIVGEFELSRRVFMVLSRVSSNRDPGAKAADSLSLNNHAVILQEKKLLDLPKLLDICAIYSHENEDLTRLMVVNAIKAQPGIHGNLIATMSHFLNIVNTMYQRCTTSLEALLSSGKPQDSGSNRLHADYLEVMDFINDAIVSIDAFVSAYKHAAVFFSCPVETSYGNEELLKTLAKLNDVLLPSLQQGFRIVYGAGDGPPNTFSDMFSNVAISLKMLSSRIVALGWKMLYFCYLNDEVFEESIPLPAATKILPAQVEDPVIRSDILVQTFREISEECATVLDGKSRGTFLQTIEKNHQLMSRIELLQNKGWISMDDEQVKFLSGIILHHSSREISCLPVMTSNKVQINEDNAIIESKIIQIKELFPDYGKGFVSACLEVYNQNPEEVIQRILEGTLHEDLLSLDTSLEMVPPKPASTLSRNDKGKGKLIESTMETSRNMVPAVNRLHIDGPPSSSSSSVGRYVRKSTSDAADSEILDTRNEKDVARTAALASQLEYEDEYDDSFDDLGLRVGDSGLEDEEINSNREKSWESGSGSSPSNASRWGSRQKPQFYVKDGKNYSYKVTGSVAVANHNEASIVNNAQRELIHGLGRGGNLPSGAVKMMIESNEGKDTEHNVAEVGGRGNSMRGRRGGGRINQRKEQPESNERENNVPDVVGRGNSTRGWGRGGRGGRSSYRKDEAMTEPNEGEDNEADAVQRGNSGNFRGRGRRGVGRNTYRKDRAMKKHFSGLSGF